MKKLLFLVLLLIGSLSFSEITYNYGNFVTSFGPPLLKEDLEKCISSPQGFRSVISKEDTGGTATSGKFHNAIDFAVPEGTKVIATKDGWVSEVYPGRLNGPQWKGDPVYGGKIVIKHYDGTETIFAHLSKTFVKQFVTEARMKQVIDENGYPVFDLDGKPVMLETIEKISTPIKKGQIIGLSGGAKGKRASGISTGPHLHYEIIINIAAYTNWSDFPSKEFYGE